MPQSGLHHLHKRKRVHENLEPYPHPEKWKNRMDKIVIAVGIIAPILTIPQLLTIWLEQNASSLSLITWMTYTISAIFWVIYGIMHKSKPIIILYVIWIIVDILIVLGILLYG